MSWLLSIATYCRQNRDLAPGNNPLVYDRLLELDPKGTDYIRPVPCYEFS
jgi:hypothetical protein